VPEHDPAQMAGQLIDWADAHGFTASERSFNGETPLLRLGTADISGVTFDGWVDGHRALLGEFFVASPNRVGIGDSGVGETHFMVLLCDVDAPRWPRITVHPTEFSDGDWLDRLLHHDDHRMPDISPEFDRHYRLRIANSIDEDDLHELLTPELVAWIADQPEMVADLENNDQTGDSLVVAARASEDRPVSPELLIAQASYLMPIFEAG
jgi:hypothetical protein